MKNFYKLETTPTDKELIAIGFPTLRQAVGQAHSLVRAVKTGEVRSVKKDEWYLWSDPDDDTDSMACRAGNDFDANIRPFPILKLIKGSMHFVPDDPEAAGTHQTPPGAP